MQVSYDSSGSGYVAVDFLDAHGKQIGAEQIAFARSERNIGNVTSDAHGFFSLDVKVDPAAPLPSYFAEYVGDPHHRLSSNLLP